MLVRVGAEEADGPVEQILLGGAAAVVLAAVAGQGVESIDANPMIGIVEHGHQQRISVAVDEVVEGFGAVVPDVAVGVAQSLPNRR